MSSTRQSGYPGPGTPERDVTGHLSVSHRATRLIFDVGQPYERFLSRFEAVVPAADPRRPREFDGRHARWPDIVPATKMTSRHGFVLYWRADMTALMTEEGDLRPCTGYLMGNPAIAEHIYRHDPAIMLYAPLRTLIYIDTDDRTRLAVDQPSTVLASFAHPAIATLGLDLDGQLAELLDALGVEASPLLRTARTVSPRSVRESLDLYPNALYPNAG
ncbi:MAG: DUF302 domain-containing protein [Streptosporangiaceae bacterium]